MHILIVEDEAGIVNFLKQGLEEEGYQITTASDGKTALQYIDKYNYDLYLLDWMVPHVSGLELCMYIRTTDSQVPILFLTAKDTVSETVEALRKGANDYIKKPFSFEELLERIKIHFRIKEPDQLIWGDVILDLKQYSVTQSGKEVAFTQREFELLKFLIEHKGSVCTRDQIIESVWNINFEYDTGVIDVFMNGIRKKLKINTSDPRLKTVRGIGFILNDPFF